MVKTKKWLQCFLILYFLSIDEQINDDDDDNTMHQIPDQSEPYNIGLLNLYLTSLLKKYLNDREF